VVEADLKLSSKLFLEIVRTSKGKRIVKSLKIRKVSDHNGIQNN
jgi:hypothetical protein